MSDTGIATALEVGQLSRDAWAPGSYRKRINAFERMLIVAALEQVGTIAGAARLLGTKRQSIQRLMTRLDIQKPSGGQPTPSINPGKWTEVTFRRALSPPEVGAEGTHNSHLDESTVPSVSKLVALLRFAKHELEVNQYGIIDPPHRLNGDTFCVYCDWPHSRPYPDDRPSDEIAPFHRPTCILVALAGVPEWEAHLTG